MSCSIVPRRFFIFLIVACVCSIRCDAATGHVIRVIGIGDTSRVLLDCTARRIESVLSTPVTASCTTNGGVLGSGIALVDAGSVERKFAGDCIVELVSGSFSTNVLTVNCNVAQINIERLAGSRGVDRGADGFQGRVEKESLRALGLILGLGSCINPSCVMYLHRNERELDEKNLSFCPPCLFDKAIESLRCKGYTITRPTKFRGGLGHK